MLVVFQLCASDLQNIELVIHRTQEFDATGVSQQRRDSFSGATAEYVHSGHII